VVELKLAKTERVEVIELERTARGDWKENVGMEVVVRIRMDDK